MKIGLGIGQQDSNRCLVVQARTSDSAGHGFSGLRLTNDLYGIRAGRRIAGATVLHEGELQIGYASQRISEVSVEGAGGDAGEIGIGRAADGRITAAPTGVSGDRVYSGQGEAIGAGGRENRGRSQRAAATGFGHVNGAAVIGGGEIAVFQAVGDDLREGGDFVGKDQIGAVGEEEVAVGVNAACETEIRSGKVAAVVA